MSDEREGFALQATSFDDLKGWRDDDPSSLFETMEACRSYIEDTKPYRTGALGLTAQDLLPLLHAAHGAKVTSAADARTFFETHCRPFRILRTGGAPGFVTAFYEPEIAVSATPDEEYRHPFYRRPEDLVDLDDTNRPAQLESGYVFGRSRDGVIDAYPDRREIDQGALAALGLEIAWAKSKVDVFFVHVQGAARLRYRDGSIGRITYAAKAGHPFRRSASC